MSLCRPCQRGQHLNCDSTAWAAAGLRPTYCECWVINHTPGAGYDVDEWDLPERDMPDENAAMNAYERQFGWYQD